MLKVEEKGCMRTVWYSHSLVSTYHGRNGFGTCTGIQVWDNKAADTKNQKPDDMIFINPITSRGESTNACTLQIPRGHLEEAASAVSDWGLLSKILDSAAIRDRLPLLVGLDPSLDTILEEKLKHGKAQRRSASKT